MVSENRRRGGAAEGCAPGASERRNANLLLRRVRRSWIRFRRHSVPRVDGRRSDVVTSSVATAVLRELFYLRQRRLCDSRLRLSSSAAGGADSDAAEAEQDGCAPVHAPCVRAAELVGHHDAPKCAPMQARQHNLLIMSRVVLRTRKGNFPAWWVRRQLSDTLSRATVPSLSVIAFHRENVLVDFSPGAESWGVFLRRGREQRDEGRAVLRQRHDLVDAAKAQPYAGSANAGR